MADRPQSEQRRPGSSPRSGGIKPESTSLGCGRQEAEMRRLAERLGLRYVDLRSVEVPPQLLQLLPVKVVFREQVIPISRADGRVQVATSRPEDRSLLDDLQVLLECDIEPVVACPEHIEQAIKRYYGIGAEAVDLLTPTVTEQAAEPSGEELAEAEEQTLIKFVNLILQEAIELRASDVHFEPFAEEFKVRYRIDGVLHEASVPAKIKRLQSAIISRIKIMAGLNIAEKRLPQDGRIQIRSHGRDIDIRVSIIPMLNGEGAVLRLLDRSSIMLGLDQLGMEPGTYELFKRVISQPHGILLVTGPTGSGKTTTLYAALNVIKNPELKLITVEDPIEYQLEGVNQIQVKPSIGLDFANILRSILRHDPDVIMVGEIRDLPTAEIAIQAAMTGHLVLSTLHTNDAPSSMTRLVDMGVEPYLVTSTVEAVMAQRLVRRLCSSCKVATDVADLRLPEHLDMPSAEKVYFAHGCQSCRFTGYHGQIGIFELMLVDEAVRRAVLEKRSSSELRRLAIDAGMVTLRRDGWRKVAAGITSIDEVMRVTRDENLSTLGYRRSERTGER